MNKFALSALGCLVLTGCGGDGGNNNNFAARQQFIMENCPYNMTCDYLSVPKDYSQPNGEMVDVFYGVHPARNPNERIGALLMNFGGPGAEAVQSAAYMAENLFPAEILDRFDIVGIDPRGAGLSVFADSLTQCAVAEYNETGSCDNTYRQVAPFLGSNSVVNDIDRLREKLGDEKLTFLGYSYGTRLGALYAHTYPDRVRAIVLDSPMSPSLANNVEIRVGNSAGYEKIASYRLDYQWNPDRERRYLTVMEDAMTNGNYIARDMNLEVSDVVQAMHATVARESSSDWSDVSFSLQSLLDDDYAYSLSWDLQWQRNVNQGEVTADDLRGNALFRAVVCTDERTPLSDNRIHASEYRYSDASALYGRLTFAETAGLCLGWSAQRDPIADMSDLGQKLNGQQILVIGGQYDPATPYVWAEEMVQALGTSASFLTMNDYVDHAFSYNNFNCIDQATTDYLIRPESKVMDRTCSPSSWYSDRFGKKLRIPHPVDKIQGF
ncbi:alpha/beta fold hydrolase [Photobacterium sp. GJ3]|uniref:alpha/beta fold hydrolase n=1 Tax=Photobacterium sp. GJ3 TaxID=2829502 RepID=UPI001B8D7D7E|nr:alpha/beta fold hydrolase [Photobacterium sp. GJ3]QUJ68108.1 alpha/beta fold hydrolase [Photobacterium sp. GJ3]